MRNQNGTATVNSVVKTCAAALLCILVAGCASPQPSSVPSPSPSSSIVFDCPPIYCADDSKDAILKAVASLGYPVKTVTVGLFGLSCGEPFPSRTASCPLATDPLPTAYVTFLGTDKIAAVEIGTVTGGPGTDTVVAVQVPPVGWSLPTPAPSPARIPDAATLTVSNGTTLTVTVFVNRQARERVPPNAEQTLPIPALPALPWNVEARSPSGRLLLAIDVSQTDTQRDSSRAALVDLSCGRLWLWVGDVTPDAPVPPTMGPPSDCLP